MHPEKDQIISNAKSQFDFKLVNFNLKVSKKVSTGRQKQTVLLLRSHDYLINFQNFMNQHSTKFDIFIQSKCI